MKNKVNVITPNKALIAKHGDHLAKLAEINKVNLEFDQMVWDFGDDDNPNWVHVSYVHDGANRKRCLKACKDDKGKTYYEVMLG